MLNSGENLSDFLFPARPDNHRDHSGGLIGYFRFKNDV